jgi:hypothetical protein
MGKVSLVAEQPGVNQMMLASQTMDLAVIMRNVKDLAKTASFLDMGGIEELHQIAYQNLKEKMVDANGVPGPLKVDPMLSMEIYKMISGVRMQAVETKRKSVDTLIKARALLDLSVPVQPNDGDDDDPFNDDGDEDGDEDGAVLKESGVFGGVLEASNSSDAEVSYGDPLVGAVGGQPPAGSLPSGQPNSGAGQSEADDILF